MAITLADFTKIWASTSPLTPYSFSESNYKEGWNFIGGTPPARQMWDSIQNQNDEKMKYIVDNFLPTAGGTMTGVITFDGDNYVAIKRSIGNKGIAIVGGDADNFSGATLQLFGQAEESCSGRFYLRASTRTGIEDTDPSHQQCDLAGYPNGDLIWNGKHIEQINASGSNYIRFESGLQVCWGRTVNFTAAGTYTVTLPVAFANADYKVVMGRYWIINQENYYFNNDRTTTTFQFVVNGNVGTNGRAYDYIAVGLWK